MPIYSSEDESESRGSDFSSLAGEDVDLHLNHYRIPRHQNGAGSSGSAQPAARVAASPTAMAQPAGLSVVGQHRTKSSHNGIIMTLTELAAQKVACHLPFGQVEHFDTPVPEPMQCRIAFWSFPQDEEDIRLYTCLANGNADVFFRAEDLVTLDCVCEMLQVGFHLSANVKQMPRDDAEFFRVAITFDRRRITTCSCTCSASTFWCQHAVAVCLLRIRKPDQLTLRAPVSESLQRLEKNQLQKFAQYLINELPQQILPAAQKLLDELLSGDEANINQNPAAPDPTAGATINEHTSWCLDEEHLSSDIQKILLKQCTSQPTVCSDVTEMHPTGPPANIEYTQLLRTVRGREPEGMWNLMSIVVEMMKRHDSNSLLLLDIMTEQVLNCNKIITWWFGVKVSLHSGLLLHFGSKHNTSQNTSQYSCSNFCDEIARLWRLAALNPSASDAERKRLYKKFFDWQLEIITRQQSQLDVNLPFSLTSNRRVVLESFPGFKSSMEGSLIDWSDWDDKRGEFHPVCPDQTPAKTTKSCKKKRRKSRANQNSQSNSAVTAAVVQPSTSPTATTEGVELDQLANTEKEAGTSSSSSSADQDPVQPEVAASVSQPTMLNHSDNNNETHSNYNHKDHDDEDQDNAENRPNVLIAKGQNCSLETSKQQPESSNSNDNNNVVNNNNINIVNNNNNNNNIVLPVAQDIEVGPVAIADDVEPLRELNGDQMFHQRQNNVAENHDIERDLRVYFMDNNNEAHEAQAVDRPEDMIKVNERKLNDNLEIMYAKVEGLYAHGHLEQSRKLACRVAKEILDSPNYPSLKQTYMLTKRRKKKSSLDSLMSIVASEALTKMSHLCNVLIEDPLNYNTVFRLVVFGLELHRWPAPTRALEVKLINQKQDLIKLLKTITLHDREICILRDKAVALRDGVYEKSSDALATLLLGEFLFETFTLTDSSLCATCYNQTKPTPLQVEPSPVKDDPPQDPEPAQTSTDEQEVQQEKQQKQDQPKAEEKAPKPVDKQSQVAVEQVVEQTVATTHIACKHSKLLSNESKLESDISLGFQAALQALSTKNTVQENEHPILCEGIRRQRGDLALAMLTHYKDDQDKLDQILEHLLDKDMMSPVPVCDACAGIINTTGANIPKKMTRPHDPHMPIEASSHFMFELAKTVFEKAGGNSLTAHLFRPQVMAQNDARGMHRNLHMCTLRIALYSLGVQNRNSVNWLQRTYNSRASFIHEQVLEIGLPAIKFLCHNWQGYLTPVEVASIADKAGCSSDPETKRVAADMARSCLDYVNFLDANAVRRILDQCKEYSVQMIEEACATIEQMAEAGNVCTDILFVAARTWYNLISYVLHPPDSPCRQSNAASAPGICIHLSAPTGQEPGPPLYAYLHCDDCLTPFLLSYEHIDYLKSSHRVGIKALNRPASLSAAKQRPPIEADINWLFELSKLLGRDNLHEFISGVMANISEPALLSKICSDVAPLYKADHVDRDQILLPLLHKAMDNYVKQIRDIFKYNAYDQKYYIDSYIDDAEKLTAEANTVTAAKLYFEMCKVVDAKTKRSKFYIDTARRYLWLHVQLDSMKCRDRDECAALHNILKVLRQFNIKRR